MVSFFSPRSNKTHKGGQMSRMKEQWEEDNRTYREGFKDGIQEAIRCVPKKKVYTKDNCIEDRFFGRGFNMAVNEMTKRLKEAL